MKKAKKNDRFSQRMATRLASLSPGLKTVLTYIDENRRAALDLSALEIAAQTGTSDATVIRAVQALGFEGLLDLKLTLKDSVEGVMSSADKMAVTTRVLSDDLDSTIDYVLESHIESANRLGEASNRRAIADAVAILKNAGKIAVFGIGASSILADYAARLFTRNGYPSYVLNRTGIALGEQLLAMEKDDVLIMMGQANSHREGVTALEEASRLGVPVILLTATPKAAFRDNADVVILIPRGEADRVPQHGTVLMCLEAVILGLAAMTAEKSNASLERLHGFYSTIRKKPRKFQ
ncbi:MurR/RpiR family transcriptional regulator [Roseibium limicola]|nr:MurR/RpiR family transcriptional regulator [Roseibium limicola]